MKKDIFTVVLILTFFLFSSAVADNKQIKENLCATIDQIVATAKPDALQQLLLLYQKSTTHSDQECIAESFAVVDGDGAAYVFIQQLQDKDLTQRQKAAFALGKIKNTEAVVPLQKALQQKELGIQCEAVLALGAMKEKGSVELLATLAEDKDVQLRSCALESLGLYGDPGFCQDFYEIWLQDQDAMVRKRAGMSFIRNDCEPHVERSAKYAMDAKSCGYTQFFINTVSDSIAKGLPEKEWKGGLGGLNIKETIVDEDTPEEIIQMRLNLVFAVMDWGESVSVIHSFSGKGSLEKNRINNLKEIEKYTKKEEYVKQFCPIIGFPDFSFWNAVIEEKDSSEKEQE